MTDQNKQKLRNETMILSSQLMDKYNFDVSANYKEIDSDVQIVLTIHNVLKDQNG